MQQRPMSFGGFTNGDPRLEDSKKNALNYAKNIGGIQVVETDNGFTSYDTMPAGVVPMKLQGAKRTIIFVC